MRFVPGYLATVVAVLLLALGTASMSLDHSPMLAAGVLGAGFGTLAAAWYLLNDRKPEA